MCAPKDSGMANHELITAALPFLSVSVFGSSPQQDGKSTPTSNLIPSTNWMKVAKTSLPLMAK